MEDRSVNALAAEAQARETALVLACNSKTEAVGLVLTKEQALVLLAGREEALKNTGRVEFGSGILDKLILAFYDSPFLDPHDYVSTLLELQDIFYFFKGEAQEKLADDDLLAAMREYFDGKCKGSLEYMAGKGLEELCRNTRYGYELEKESGGDFYERNH